MFCKAGVLTQNWRVRVPHHTTLYAFSFCSSSYTLMATVCRFSPSHFEGIFLAGLRSGKERRLLPHYAEDQLGLSFGILRGDESVPHSLGADLFLYFKKAWSSSKIQGPTLAKLGGFAGPLNFVRGTALPYPSLLARN